MRAQALELLGDIDLGREEGDLGAQAFIVRRAERLPQALGELLLVRRDRLRHERRDAIQARAHRLHPLEDRGGELLALARARRDELVERAPAQRADRCAQAFIVGDFGHDARPAKDVGEAQRRGLRKRFCAASASVRSRPSASDSVWTRPVPSLDERQPAVDLAA